MKRLLQNSPYNTHIDSAILLARLGIAALMLSHGIPKLGMLFSGTPVQFPPVFGLSPELSLGLTVFAEVFCSILLALGLVTRLAAIPLIITMLVAVVAIHGSDPFPKQEPAIQYLLVYTILLFTGSGKYSLDYYVLKNTGKAYATERINVV